MSILVAAALKQVGFDTQQLTDAKRDKLWGAISEFARDKAANSNAVLIYLAGHGVQVKNQSYFLPIEVRSRSEEDFEIEGISLKSIVDYVTAKGSARTYVFVIDACREIVIKREG